MLVLSRREGEEIVIGDDIVITVIRISADKVRIGVSAPLSVPVHRAEIQQRVEAELAERERVEFEAFRDYGDPVG